MAVGGSEGEVWAWWVVVGEEGVGGETGRGRETSWARTAVRN